MKTLKKVKSSSGMKTLKFLALAVSIAASSPMMALAQEVPQLTTQQISSGTGVPAWLVVPTPVHMVSNFDRNSCLRLLTITDQFLSTGIRTLLSSNLARASLTRVSAVVGTSINSARNEAWNALSRDTRPSAQGRMEFLRLFSPSDRHEQQEVATISEIASIANRAIVGYGANERLFRALQLEGSILDISSPIISLNGPDLVIRANTYFRMFVDVAGSRISLGVSCNGSRPLTSDGPSAAECSISEINGFSPLEMAKSLVRFQVPACRAPLDQADGGTGGSGSGAHGASDVASLQQPARLSGSAADR